MATMTSASLDPNNRASDRAYVELKSMILRGTVAPGEVINEPLLMEELGVGRTPLREAISRLAAEQLVTVLPRRGAFVSELRVSDIQHVFELRLLLEDYCARLAAERITDSEIQQLVAMLEDPILLHGTDEQAIDVDQRFHDLLASSTQNPYLKGSLERLRNLSLSLLYLSRGVFQKREQIKSSLMGVVEATQRRDADAAARALRQHVQEFRERVRNTL